jgi:hypothetical protein
VALAVAVGILLLVLEAQALLGKETLVPLGRVVVMAGNQVAVVVQALLLPSHFTEQVEPMDMQAAVELE